MTDEEKAVIIGAIELHPDIAVAFAKFIIATHVHVSQTEVDAGFAVGVAGIDLGGLPLMFIGAYLETDRSRTLDVAIARLQALKARGDTPDVGAN